MRDVTAAGLYLAPVLPGAYDPALMLACILVGNTTVRHAVLDGEGPVGGAIVSRGVIPIPRDGTPIPSGWLPRDLPIEAVLVASVNPPRLAEVLAGRDVAGRRLLVAGRDLPIPIPNRYADPARAGIDRLLNALSASRLLPGRGAVVVDFGTALSVSVVSPAGEFLGGPIAGGVRSIAAGLAARTAGLPFSPPDGPPGIVLSTSTEEALRAGIFLQVAGAASSILASLDAELRFPFTAIATGGDAGTIARAVPRISRIEPDLALRGLAIARAALVAGEADPLP